MTTHPDPSKQIEDIVRQHVDTLRASAAAAVARAFTASSPPTSARTSTQPRPVFAEDTVPCTKLPTITTAQIPHPNRFHLLFAKDMAPSFPDLR